MSELAPLLDAVERLTAAVLTGVQVDKRPDFPRPHQVGDGEKGRRWKATDVIEWVDGR